MILKQLTLYNGYRALRELEIFNHTKNSNIAYTSFHSPIAFCTIK